jgi:hypothetical protein
MHPVHYYIEKPERFTRLQLAVRVVAFCALGVLGLSFGMVFLFAYLALPVFVASRLATGRDPRSYLEREGQHVLSALRWFAALSAWAGLVAEHLPGSSPEEAVTIEVEGSPNPTTSSAFWRILTGLPSAIVLAILGWFGVFVWMWAALSILFVQRVGPRTFRYLVGLQRWSIRLLAYQASLVDEYPPFSFEDVPSLPFSQARTVA